MNTPREIKLIGNRGKGNTVKVGIAIINPDPALSSGRQDGTLPEKGKGRSPRPRIVISRIFRIY